MFHHLTKERCGSYLSGSREDLAAIFSYHWKTPRHMREAIKLLLASYLDDSEPEDSLRSTMPMEEFAYLEEKAEAQLQLAANPSTNETLLEYLTRLQPGVRVLEHIATNPRCSGQTLSKLARHKSPDVRAAVSESQNCTSEILESLARDVHPDVRYRLAENPGAGKVVLESLSSDENPFVASRANETLKRMSSAVVVGRFPTAESNRLRVVSGQ